MYAFPPRSIIPLYLFLFHSTSPLSSSETICQASSLSVPALKKFRGSDRERKQDSR
jgi:hypothetical protein